MRTGACSHNQGLGGRQALPRRALPLRGLCPSPPGDERRRHAERGGRAVGGGREEGDAGGGQPQPDLPGGVHHAARRGGRQGHAQGQGQWFV